MKKNVEKTNLKKMPLDIDKMISQVYDEISSLGINITYIDIKFARDFRDGNTNVYCHVFFEKDIEQLDSRFAVAYEEFGEYNLEGLIIELKKEFEKEKIR